MRSYFCTEPKLDFDDILLVPQFADSNIDVSTRNNVELTCEFNTPTSKRTLRGIPIIASNMDGVGTFEMARTLASHNCFTALHKHHSPEDLINFWKHSDAVITSKVFYSIGTNSEDIAKYNAVKHDLNKLDIEIQNICFDVANLYSLKFYDFLLQFREDNPSTVIMAGNVVTPEAVRKLSNVGVDIVKLGIGPSSVCTTRTQTGVGYPQLSCIMEAAASTESVILCSDGGCNHPGDFSKAFAAGADFVMTGSMLSGTDEGGGEVVDGNVLFYGMSSKTANNKHFGGLMDYRSSEGRTVMVPYKGSIRTVIQNILGGIRSTCTYVGVNELSDLSKNSSYIRVNNNINRSFERHTIGD